MKQHADKHRWERSFAVGDQAFLKLQTYIQSSVAKRANHKLPFCYYWPYKVTAKINDVAYKLDLPAQATVHLVFHVSQLRHALLPGTSAEQHLPIESDVPVVPEEVLLTRWKRQNGAMVEQVLIRGSNRAAVNDTWENKAELQVRFPSAAAWGQAASQEGGDVITPDIRARPTSASRASGPYPRPKRQAWPNPRGCDAAVPHLLNLASPTEAASSGSRTPAAAATCFLLFPRSPFQFVYPCL